METFIGKFLVRRAKMSNGFHGSPDDFLTVSPKLTGDFAEWTPKK